MWLAAIEIGFVGFIASLFCAAWRGFNSSGGARRPLGFWLLAAFVFFAMWIAGLNRYPIPLNP